MIVKKPVSIRVCRNVGASVGMGDLNKPQETEIVTTEDKDRKLLMWIVCCGCDKPQNLFDNIYGMKSKPLTYYSRCPYCGFEHKLIVQKG